MLEYGNLPKLTESQISNFRGKKGLVTINSETGHFVAFDGKKVGGYVFENENDLDQYLKNGIIQSYSIPEEAGTEETGTIEVEIIPVEVDKNETFDDDKLEDEKE